MMREARAAAARVTHTLHVPNFYVCVSVCPWLCVCTDSRRKISFNHQTFCRKTHKILITEAEVAMPNFTIFNAIFINASKNNTKISAFGTYLLFTTYNKHVISTKI